MKITISRANQAHCCQSSTPNPNHQNPCTPPRGIDPVAWAEYNARQNQTLAAISGLPAPVIHEVETLEVRTEITGALSALLQCVQRAASELEGTSEKGDRVSLQLLTALARFHAEVGTP